MLTSYDANLEFATQSPLDNYIITKYIPPSIILNVRNAIGRNESPTSIFERTRSGVHTSYLAALSPATFLPAGGHVRDQNTRQ